MISKAARAKIGFSERAADVGGYILEPYSQGPLEITLRNVTSSPASATTTKQSWSCTYKGLDKTQSCGLSPATTALSSPK